MSSHPRPPGRKEHGGGSLPHKRRDKLVVTFDEDARREFLTGFRKRKQQRRAAAEAAAKEKERTARREEKAALRREQQEELNAWEAALKGADVTVFAAPATGAVGTGGDAATSTTTLRDAFSQRTFGASAVVVSTKPGLPSADAPSEDHLVALAALRRTKQGKLAATGGAGGGGDDATEAGVGRKRGRDEVGGGDAPAQPKPWSKKARPEEHDNTATMGHTGRPGTTDLLRR